MKKLTSRHHLEAAPRKCQGRIFRPVRSPFPARPPLFQDGLKYLQIRGSQRRKAQFKPIGTTPVAADVRRRNGPRGPKNPPHHIGGYPAPPGYSDKLLIKAHGIRASLRWLPRWLNPARLLPRFISLFLSRVCGGDARVSRISDGDHFGGRLVWGNKGGHWSAESAANSLGAAGSASRCSRRVPLAWVGGDPWTVLRITIRPGPGHR